MPRDRQYQPPTWIEDAKLAILQKIIDAGGSVSILSGGVDIRLLNLLNWFVEDGWLTTDILLEGQSVPDEITFQVTPKGYAAAKKASR